MKNSLQPHQLPHFSRLLQHGRPIFLPRRLGRGAEGESRQSRKVGCVVAGFVLLLVHLTSAAEVLNLDKDGRELGGHTDSFAAKRQLVTYNERETANVFVR